MEAPHAVALPPGRRRPPLALCVLEGAADLAQPGFAEALPSLGQHLGLFLLHVVLDVLLPELAGRRVLRRLDGPVDDTVPANRPITVRDLLTFRMGLGMIMGPPDVYPIQKAASELQIVGFGPPNQSTPHDPDG